MNASSDPMVRRLRWSVLLATLLHTALACASPAASTAPQNTNGITALPPGQTEFEPGDPLPLKKRPPERMPGVVTRYGSVEVEPGVRLRTLVSAPLPRTQPLPALLFTQWVSCGSLQIRSERPDIDLKLLAQHSGMALVRVERAGSGDSQGPGCDKLDYDTEVSHYISAFSALLKHDWIDSDAVYIYGSSLGSTVAPLVAEALQQQGHRIAGVMVQGGGALTHYERMLHFDRMYLERRPDVVPASEIDAQMRARTLFHTEYLLRRRHPDDVAKDSPEMSAVRADVRGLSATDHYGRPFSWHQQAAQHNFLAAWTRIEAPVLVIFNEFDQFETRHGHRLIVDTVNALRPDTATLIEQPGLGHSSYRFDSIEAAYQDEAGVRATAQTAQQLLTWLQSVHGAQP